MIKLKGRGHRRYDPVAWLAHADELEDAGQPEEGKLVRRKGLVMQALLEAVAKYVVRGIKPRGQVDLPCGMRAYFTGGHKLVILTLRWGTDHRVGTQAHMGRPLSTTPNYLPRKVLSVLEGPGITAWLTFLKEG